MRLVPFIITLLVAAPVLAGCVANPIPRNAQASPELDAAHAADWFDRALPRGSGHNHGALHEHKGLSTSNFELLGHAGLTTYDARGRLVTFWGCAESGVRADGRILAIANGFSRDAFVLADLTDPANPFKVGEFILRGVSGYDAALTRDGKFAVLAFNSIARAPPVGAAAVVDELPSLTFEDACGVSTAIPLPDVAVHNGVILLDLADPTRPTFGDYWPMPSVNLHSVATADVDGLQYIVASVVDLVPAASYWQFLLATETPAGGKLAPLAHFSQPAVAAPQRERVAVPTWNGHAEASIARHPVDGHVYAYLSAWDAGMITLDITVPTAPVMVANWMPPVGSSPIYLSGGISDSGCYHMAVHDVFPIAKMRDGRYYILAQQECPFLNTANQPGGQVYVIDNTDPLNPKTAGAWNLPVKTGPWQVQYQASPHYLDIIGDTMFVSMYHAGVWAVDLSGDLRAPPSIGVFVPDRDPATPSSASTAPTTLQVNALPDGTLAIWEARSGVYVVGFDANDPAPAAPPAFKLP